jgi:hypothetical protein
MNENDPNLVNFQRSNYIRKGLNPLSEEPRLIRKHPEEIFLPGEVFFRG